MREYYHPNEQEIINTLIDLFENRKEDDWKVGVSTISGLIKEYFNKNEVHVSFEDDDLTFTFQTSEIEDEKQKLYHQNNRLMMGFFALLRDLMEDKLIHFIGMNDESITKEKELINDIGETQITEGKKNIKFEQPYPEIDLPGNRKFTFKEAYYYIPIIKIPYDYFIEEFGINIYTTIFPTEALINLAHNNFESIEKRRFDIALKESKKQLEESKKQTKWSRRAFFVALLALILTFSFSDFDKTILKWVIDNIVGLFKSAI